jgi:hypothetical protein
MHAQQATAGETPVRQAVKQGEQVVRQLRRRRGYCTGDHACIRLSAVPAVGQAPAIRSRTTRWRRSTIPASPAATGEVAEAAVLCPSFYRADIIHNRTARPSYRPAHGRDRRPAALARAPDPSPEPSHGRAECDGSPTASGYTPLGIAAGPGSQVASVLVDWIVALAQAQDHFVQATSVPGVAQRTGATIYYVEIIAPDGSDDGRSCR